jgi:hypothetical protein
VSKPHKLSKTQRIVVLERELREALAGQAHVYHFAEQGLAKASTDHLTTSGVVLTLTVLGGRELFRPVLLRDGLSHELIAALKADLKRSYELSTLFKPKGV